MKTEAVLCASPQWTANSRQPYSYARTSHGGGHSLAYPLRRCASLTKISFQITGRPCFCLPRRSQPAGRAVFIGQGKSGLSPWPAFRKPPEPARRQNAAPAKATPSPPAYPIRSLPLFAFSLFTPHIPTFAARKSKPHIIDCGRTVPKIGVRQSGSRLTRGRSYPASSRNTGI